MLTVRVEGLDEARKLVEGFSDRRFAGAVATALTRTAAAVRTAWRAELESDLDRPTPLTRGAPLSRGATAASLVAEVFLRDQVRAGGVPPSEYIATQERGGSRDLRKFERALVAGGNMPAGQRAVPGRAAQLDAYGNVSRGQIVRVLNQLGRALSPGYARVIGASAAKRAAVAARSGQQYVAIPRDQGRLRAGIYQRAGRGLLPVFFFVSSVRYPRRTSLIDAAARLAQQRFPAELRRSLAENQARVNARSARGFT